MEGNTIKLTEKETLNILAKYFENNGYKVYLVQYNIKSGSYIIAELDDLFLFVEVRGARYINDTQINESCNFDREEIKTYFGRVIVKILDQIRPRSKVTFAIALPFDEEIVRAVGGLTPFINQLGIKHYWVNENGEVTDEQYDAGYFFFSKDSRLE